MPTLNQHASHAERQGPRLLILGGTGFLSGSLLRRSGEQGFDTWIATRGHHPVPDGVKAMQVDRDHPASFAQAMARVEWEWDAVIDCIGFGPDHGEQDIAVFRGRARQLIFVSSDAVYDPARRAYPQPVEPAAYVKGGYGWGKLGCEEAIKQGAGETLGWTILRPPHIYGPGSALGCLPPAFRDPRLPKRILAGDEIGLAGGGWFLHQPIFVDDLARLILSLVNLPGACGRIFNTPGRTITTMRAYYEAIAAALDRQLRVREIPVERYLEEHPEAAAAVCHRLYEVAPLADLGAVLPSISIEMGMRLVIKDWRAKAPPVASLSPVTTGAPLSYGSATT